MLVTSRAPALHSSPSDLSKTRSTKLLSALSLREKGSHCTHEPPNPQNPSDTLFRPERCRASRQVPRSLRTVTGPGVPGSQRMPASGPHSRELQAGTRLSPGAQFHADTVKLPARDQASSTFPPRPALITLGSGLSRAVCQAVDATESVQTHQGLQRPRRVTPATRSQDWVVAVPTPWGFC